MENYRKILFGIYDYFEKCDKIKNRINLHLKKIEMNIERKNY